MKTHGEVSRRMREQYWQIDRAIALHGPDICWPMSSIALGCIGPDVAGDIQNIRASCKKCDDISVEYAKYAVKREEMAKRAEAEGHLVTAGDSYFAAAFFYGCAMFPIHEDDNEKSIAFNAKKVECYNKFIKYSRRPVERVEIPFEGKSLAGLLHLPADRAGKVPCILDIVGMDGFKEQSNPLNADKHLERGMAVFTLDIPGHGEALISKIKCTPDNVVQAGRAAVDYLTTRPEIDADKIVVSGISFGSFWSVLIAAHDDRLKAVAGRLFCHEPGFDTIFNTAQPPYKARFIWMAGYEDEDKFDKFAQTLTWKGLAAKIKCPFLMVGGEFDELSPLEYTYDLYNEVKTPKKLVVYAGQTHSLHHAYIDAVTICTDWLRDRLDGKPMESEEIIYIDMLGRITKK